jgi:acyl-coenzyme A thioesterase PaaI-like protein
MRARLAGPGSLSMAEVSALSPAEFFEGIGNGELPSPPIGTLMDFIPIQWSTGLFIFQGTPDARHYNPLGTVHGGYAATLLDSCMGCAVHTQLKKGQGYTTLDLRISYVRALNNASGPARLCTWGARRRWPRGGFMMWMGGCMRRGPPLA